MQNLSIFIGSGGIIGVLVLFFYFGRWFGKIDAKLEIIDKRFDSVDKRFDKIDNRFDVIDKKFDFLIAEIKGMNAKFTEEFRDVRKDLAIIDSKLGKLEVRVEERTLRVIHVQKQFQELAPVNEN